MDMDKEQFNITGIIPHKHKSDVYSLHIDGKYAFDIHGETLEKISLAVGEIISLEKLEEIRSDEKYIEAVRYAYLLISYRKRTGKEFLDKLKEKGYTDNVCIRVVEYLKKEAYVDDYSFALSWIRQRMSNKPKGRTALKHELRLKGVEDFIIDKAFEYLETENIIDEHELARKACSAKLKSYSSLPYMKRRKRLIDFLKRRGFNWEVIKDIVEEII
jgi:regulatory protein